MLHSAAVCDPADTISPVVCIDDDVKFHEDWFANNGIPAALVDYLKEARRSGTPVDISVCGCCALPFAYRLRLCLAQPGWSDSVVCSTILDSLSSA
jgi:hypothetical protein